MKIAKKIMASNMIIGFFVTFLLSIMILVVVNNFIRDNAFYNMEIEISHIARMLEYKDIKNIIKDDRLVGKPYNKRKITTDYTFIVLDEKGEVITHSAYIDENEFEDKFYKALDEAKADEFINLQSAKSPVVIYKKLVTYTNEEGEHEIQIIGLVYNSLLYKLLFDMMIPIIVVLFVVVILSFIIAAIHGKKITKPVETLITMTKRISQKEEVVSTIQSSDEFQIISNALEKMSAELNSKDIESKQFYEHVSHDLKTPLTIISGYAEGISNGIFDDQVVPLEKIVKQCNKLKTQIEDVIFLSQLETNRQVFNYSEVIIEDIISEVLDDFEVLFIKCDIEVTYIPSKKTRLLLDKEKMIRVITNIISNVIKYTESELTIQIIEVDNKIKISFMDNGAGFSQEVLEDPFKGYHDNNKPGNGIGLMIIHRIMEGHKGQVTIYNKNQGAVVELLISKSYTML